MNFPRTIRLLTEKPSRHVNGKLKLIISHAVEHYTENSPGLHSCRSLSLFRMVGVRACLLCFQGDTKHCRNSVVLIVKLLEVVHNLKHLFEIKKA